MTRADTKLFKDVAKGMALLVLVLFACGKTMGAGAIAVAGAAFMCAVSGRIGWAIIGYILFPFMVIMNPFVVPKGGGRQAWSCVWHRWPLHLGFSFRALLVQGTIKFR